MAKILWLLVFSFLSLLATADEPKKKITTTFTIIADMAQNIAGDAAIVESITKPGADIHTYQPTPKDIIRAQKADLVLYNGMNLELWFERFLQDIQDVPHVVVTQNIQPLSIYEGSYSGKPNPHAWMSPKNGLIYVENIRKALVELDPQNAQIYTKNAQIYTKKIQNIIKWSQDEFQKIKKSGDYLVTSEGAFSYLADDFGMKEAYIWPINADQQGSPKQISKLIDLVNKEKIPVVFSESTISPKPAQQIARETNAIYGGVLYVDSLSRKNGPVPTYLDLLRVTIETILNGYEEGTKHDK
ncbi:MAG: metal ABC transporter substrate-binding protein [Alphaproteobacteria bacterium]